MSGNIFNSKGTRVGVVDGATIFSLNGQELYHLNGINIYRLSGELVGHLNRSFRLGSVQGIDPTR
jgi:hypothetical protein